VPAGLSAARIAEASATLMRRPAPETASDLDRLVAYLFARREAVASSRMEGTWTTIDRALTPGDVLDGREARSERMSVRAYAAALEGAAEEVREAGVAALTTDLVCRLHERVMSRDPHFRGIAGRIRQPGTPGDIVQIGRFPRKEASVFNPPLPAYVGPCLEAVMAWLRDEELIELGDAGMGMALPVRMAVGHSHFEAVHPFSDGNGRVGRMLWPLQMLAAGHLPLYISGYIEEHTAAYSQALQAAQKKLDYSEIVAFVCDAVIASSADERATKVAIEALPYVWRGRASFRARSSPDRALGVLMRLPIMTARQLSTELGVSFQAASTALKSLEKAGVVRERTGYGRNRVFAAEEVIALLSRPFGQDPEIALEGAREVLGIRGDW
jgi:Fic family protein